MNFVPPEQVRASIVARGLLSVADCHARRRVALDVAAELGVCEQTVYRQLKRAQEGLPARKPRSDRGSYRALSEAQLRALRDALSRLPGRPKTFYHRLLLLDFPEEPVTYGTVARVLPLLLADAAPENPVALAWSPERLRFLLDQSGLNKPVLCRLVGIPATEVEGILKGSWIPPASLSLVLPVPLGSASPICSRRCRGVRPVAASEQYREQAAHLVQLRLHTDLLTRAELKAARKEFLDRWQVSEWTLRRRISEVRDQGKLQRPARADRGRSRKITGPARDTLFAIVKNSPMQSVRLIGDAFRRQCSEVECSPDSIDREVERIKQEIKASLVETPQPIDFRYPLDRVEVDFSVADFFAFDADLDPRLPKRPVLAAAIDCHSRMILWAGYYVHSDRETYGALLYHAIMPKPNHEFWPCHGTPQEVFADWGKVFKSGQADAVLADLGIMQGFGNAYRPQDKGRVERLFQTIHRGFEDGLPGLCGSDNKGDNGIDPQRHFRFDGRLWRDPRGCLDLPRQRPLLNLQEANELLQEWIINHYHSEVHSELGCSPLTAWSAAIGDVQERLDRALPVDLLEEACLLLRETRTVNRGTVRVRGHEFFAEQLASYEGLKVEVRFSMEDRTGVSVYRDGRRLCRAALVGAQFVEPGVRSFRKAEGIARAERERKQRLKGIPAEVTPPEAADLRARLAPVAARQAEPVLLPAGGVRELADPAYRGLTDEEAREVADLDLWGFSLAPSPENDPAEDAPDDLELTFVDHAAGGVG